MPERRPKVCVITCIRPGPVGWYVVSIARRMSSAIETLDLRASLLRKSYCVVASVI
jgi:hypothetical protein